MLGKLLGLTSIGEAISSLHLARKFVADLILIIMLTVIGAMLTGAMAIAGLYECDQLLMRHGLDADMAALVAAVIGLLILAVMAGFVAYKIRNIQRFPFRSSSPVVGMVSGSVQSVVRGFLHGLSDKRPL